MTEGLNGLADAMASIEGFVHRTWGTDHMPWFTDHGVGHSERVAHLALEIGSPTGINPSLSLNAYEKFILWSAAWLHDVGMQQLLGTKLGSGGHAVYGRIRREHPNQSSVVIVNNAPLIGLRAKDRPILGAIAYVARAHGTEYYEDSVATLTASASYVHGYPIRGGLLSAALLMADELDLGHDRALRLPMPEELNDISSAHALKHDCVTKASVEHVKNGDVVITVHTSHFPGVTSEQITSIERWILEKLWKQISRTEYDFTSGFDGQARFSRGIRIERTAGIVPMETPSPAVMAVIEADNIEDDLLNHRESLTSARRLLLDRVHVALTGRSSASSGDEDGREDLFAALIARERAEGRRLAQSTCLRESAGAASLEDVVIELAESCRSEDAESAQGLEASIEQLQNYFELADPVGIVAVSCLDRLTISDQHELLQTILPRICSVGGFVAVITADITDPPGPIGGGMFTEVNTSSLSREGIEKSLSPYIPRYVAVSEAATQRFRYMHYASLRQNHVLAILGE